MGIASVSAGDVTDCEVNESEVDVTYLNVNETAVDGIDYDVNESAACVCDVDAYEYAEDDHVEQPIYDADSNTKELANCADELDNNTRFVNYTYESKDTLSFHMLYSNFEIQKKIDGNKLDVKLNGRFDVDSAKSIEPIINDLDNITELTFDFKDTNYISTSVLGVLLKMQKVMDQKGGSMKLINLPSNIMYVMEVTGFCEIFTIE